MTSLGSHVGRFYLWAYRLSEDLDATESVINDAFASLLGRFAALQGRLILTESRLIFLSKSLRPGLTDQVRLVASLEEILAVELDSELGVTRIMPGFSIIKIVLPDQSMQFRLPQAQRFVDEVQKAANAAKRQKELQAK